MDAEQEKVCREEADGYLRKPFQVDTFNDTIVAGVSRRLKLNELSELVADQKKVSDLLSGKIKVENVKSLKDPAKAKEILTDLATKINLAS
jgi:response regulator of citrate/malate metabolism